MHRRIVLSFFMLLALVSVAQAVPTINVGANPLPNTSPTQTDTIIINYDATSSGGISGQTLFISVADEGNGQGDPADPGEPRIVSVDSLTGTNWVGNVNGPVYSPVGDQVMQTDQTTAANTISPTGIAFRITIDRNGAPNGSTWPLRIFINVPGLGGPYDSNWSSPTATGVSFAGSNGNFSYAPEPSSIVLGLFAAAGLGAVVIRRRRARS